MGIKLQGNERVVDSKDLEDGDVGVIVDWTNGDYIDQVVQRTGRDLITLGAPRNDSWIGYYDSPGRNDCLIRLLSPGEILVVT